jgi:hypothetical protein
MARPRPDKNKSQIVFDVTGGEKTFDTMTLRTLPNRTKFIKSQAESFSLRTDDIDGARWVPNPYATRDSNLNISDIEGTRAVPSVNLAVKPIDIMDTSDIEGAHPKCKVGLPNSKRHTNPLMPEYQLPSKVEDPPPELPFLYDGMNFDDIPGVHPRSYKTDKPPRDIMRVSDIPGCRPRQLTRKLDRSNRILDVDDINHGGEFHTKRCTNPLAPEYLINGEVIGNDFGHASSNYRTRRDGVDFQFTTKDIEGAQADTSTRWIRDFKQPKPVEEGEEMPVSATSLMLPSMVRQTEQLDRQRAIDQMRGEKIRRAENRRLIVRESSDRLQTLMRKGRQACSSAPRSFTFRSAPILL